MDRSPHPPGSAGRGPDSASDTASSDTVSLDRASKNTEDDSRRQKTTEEGRKGGRSGTSLSASTTATRFASEVTAMHTRMSAK
eukprot:1911354-Rhodomonas_salina.3